MLRSIGKQTGESAESVLKKKRKATVGRICRIGRCSQAFFLLPLLTNTLPGPSASVVTTLWRYTNLFIITIIIFLYPR